MTAAATTPARAATSAGRRLLNTDRHNVSPRGGRNGHSGASSDPEDRPLRRLAWELHDAYRIAGSEKVRKCGHCRLADKVGIHRRGTEAYFVGLVRCKDIWACPTCSMRIRAARGKELQHVVEWHADRWGWQAVTMLSATITHHGTQHDLRAMRKGVAAAWRRFISGAGWQAFERQYGLEGHVRALEVTHGPTHGWHPHLHVLLLTRTPLPVEVEALLYARWADAVLHALGSDYVPKSIGVKLTRNPGADYLIKFGLKMTLELLSTGSKTGKVGPDGEPHRTPIAILADWVQRGRKDEDLRLYQEYTTAMYGARMLTWSVGLRKKAKLADLTEDQLLEGETGLAEELPVERIGVVEPGEWSYLRGRPGVKVALLDIAGQFGTDALYYAMDVLLAQADPDELELRGVDPAGLGKRLRPKHPDEMDVLLLLPRRGGQRVQVI